MENSTIIVLVTVIIIGVLLVTLRSSEPFCNCSGMNTKIGKPTYVTYRDGDVSHYGMHRGWGITMPDDQFAYMQQGCGYTADPKKVVDKMAPACPSQDTGYATLGQVNGDGTAMSYAAMGGGDRSLSPVTLLSDGLPKQYVGPAGSFTDPSLNNLGGGKACTSKGMYDLGTGVL